MARNSNTKSDNKAVIDLPKTKTLSPKQSVELDHIQGKHKAFSRDAAPMLAKDNPSCGFCQRRVARNKRRFS